MHGAVKCEICNILAKVSCRWSKNRGTDAPSMDVSARCNMDEGSRLAGGTEFSLSGRTVRRYSAFSASTMLSVRQRCSPYITLAAIATTTIATAKAMWPHGNVKASPSMVPPSER